MRVALKGALVVLVALALFMSWGALYDLALLAGGMPPERAIVFPVVVDVVTVVAMLLVLIAPSGNVDAKKFARVTLAVFGALTIAGNAAEVLMHDGDRLALGLIPGIVINSVPAVALLMGTHLVSLTAFTDDVPVEVAPERIAAARAPRAPRERARKVASPEQVALVKALREEEKLSYAAISSRTGVPKTTVIRWLDPEAVTG